EARADLRGQRLAAGRSLREAAEQRPAEEGARRRDQERDSPRRARDDGGERDRSDRADEPEHSLLQADRGAARGGARELRGGREREAVPRKAEASRDDERGSEQPAGGTVAGLRSGRVKAASGWEAGSRRKTAPASAPAAHAAARARSAARTPTASTSGGRASEAARPPIGTFVCRIPSASPRSERGNHCITARPPAAFPPA